MGGSRQTFKAGETSLPFIHTMILSPPLSSLHPTNGHPALWRDHSEPLSSQSKFKPKPFLRRHQLHWKPSAWLWIVTDPCMRDLRCWGEGEWASCGVVLPPAWVGEDSFLPDGSDARLPSQGGFFLSYGYLGAPFTHPSRALNAPFIHPSGQAPQSLMKLLSQRCPLFKTTYTKSNTLWIICEYFGYELLTKLPMKNAPFIN